MQDVAQWAKKQNLKKIRYYVTKKHLEEKYAGKENATVLRNKVRNLMRPEIVRI